MLSLVLPFSGHSTAPPELILSLSEADQYKVDGYMQAQIDLHLELLQAGDDQITSAIRHHSFHTMLGRYVTALRVDCLHSRHSAMLLGHLGRLDDVSNVIIRSLSDLIKRKALSDDREDAQEFIEMASSALFQVGRCLS